MAPPEIELKFPYIIRLTLEKFNDPEFFKVYKRFAYSFSVPWNPKNIDRPKCNVFHQTEIPAELAAKNADSGRKTFKETLKKDLFKIIKDQKKYLLRQFESEDSNLSVYVAP